MSKHTRECELETSGCTCGAEDKLFVIQHVEHPGDYVLFWKDKRAGYTVNLDEAGRYTEEEARAIVVGRPEEDVALVWTDVDKLTLRVVPRERAYFLLKVYVPKNIYPRQVVVEQAGQGLKRNNHVRS